jgi:hypothetical protein
MNYSLIILREDVKLTKGKNEEEMAVSFTYFYITCLSTDGRTNSNFQRRTSSIERG